MWMRGSDVDGDGERMVGDGSGGGRDLGGRNSGGEGEEKE